MELTQKISPSLVNYVRQCPLRWKLDKIGAPQIPIYVKEADLGFVFHNIIKLYFQNIHERPTSKQIRSVAEKMFEVGYTLDTMKIKAKRLLENFIQFETNRLKTWRVYKPEMVEEKIEIGKDKIKSVLNIDVPENFVTIIDFYGDKTWLDWKTGAMPYMTEELQFQYGFSKLMLELSEHMVEKAYFVSLSSGTQIEPPRTTTGWVLQIIKVVLNIVQNERFRPHRTHLCNYCPYTLFCDFSNTCLFWGV